MQDQEKNSKFRAVLDFLKRLMGKRPAQPGDPYAYVMAPVRRGPRDGAVRRWPTLKTTPSAAFRREDKRSVLRMPRHLSTW
ncbi:MAG: hypothetical protein WA485_21175 [Candidatus Sulfotelmatobacter sp.]